MKRLLLVILSTLFFAGTACADRKTPISPDRLPQAAQQFLRAQFPGTVPTMVFRDGGEYEAYTNDGSYFEFDRKGKWTEIKYMDGIPKDVLPTAIHVYLINNFPHDTVVKIERKRRSYDVELANGLDLEFDSKGNFRGVDD